VDFGFFADDGLVKSGWMVCEAWRALTLSFGWLMGLYSPVNVGGAWGVPAQPNSRKIGSDRMLLPMNTKFSDLSFCYSSIDSSFNRCYFNFAKIRIDIFAPAKITIKTAVK
jgi:hypothetical protein